jgi:O-antigen/teichoic acid export membrane protein
VKALRSQIHLLHRWIWAVGDQAVVSCVNLACGVAVAREVSQSAFGAFAIALTVYWLALGVSRALTTEPYAVRFAARDALDRSAAPAAMATAVVVGGVTSAGAIAATVVVSEPLRTALLAIAAVLPLLLLQDILRSAAFAGRRARVAFVGDSAWLATFVAAWLTLGASGHGGLVSFVLAWGFSSGVAALVLMSRLRVVPRFSAAATWVLAHRDIGLRFLAEALAGIAMLQLSLVAVAAIAGLEAVGSIRAAQVLFGPWQVLLMGTVVFALPESARLLASGGRGALTRFADLVGASLALVAVCWGVALLALPDSIGREIVGASWSGADDLLFITGLSLAPPALIAGATLGLRALAAVDRSLPTQLVTATLVVAGACAGAALGEARGALIGVAVAGGVAAAGWWRQLRLACRDRSSRGSASTAAGPAVDGRT